MKVVLLLRVCRQSTSSCSASKSSVGSCLQILITAASKLPLLSILSHTHGGRPPTRRQQLSPRRAHPPTHPRAFTGNKNTLSARLTGSQPAALFCLVAGNQRLFRGSILLMRRGTILPHWPISSRTCWKRSKAASDGG